MNATRSKSQHYHDRPYAYRRPCQCGHRFAEHAHLMPHVQWPCMVAGCQCIEWTTKSRKAKAQMPEPPSEIVIERWQDHWCIVNGSHRAVIIDMPGYTDPMIVSKALKAKANGPINVVWNL